MWNGIVDSRQSSDLSDTADTVTYLLVCYLYRLEDIGIVLSRIELIASGEHSSILIELLRCILYHMLLVGKANRMVRGSLIQIDSNKRCSVCSVKLP